MIIECSDEPQSKWPSLWLCLSGGGFRAALFHYGCLKRLRELNLLSYVYAYSATSGGALVAALLACNSGGKRPQDWESFENTLLSLATRGLLGLVALLFSAYCFYGIALISFLWTPMTSAAFLLIGLSLHFVLAFVLLTQGAHKHSREEQIWPEISGAPAVRNCSHSSLARFFHSLVSLSYLRIVALNLRAFHWERLTQISVYPKIFLTALDLNEGTEKVFTQGTSGVLTDLDALGCRELWENESDREGRQIPDVEIASAVAASTAFPPLFRPVTVQSKGQVRGVFVDGGVVDNYAANVPKAFAVHIHPDRSQRYDGSPEHPPSFYDATCYVAILDGSKISKPRNKVTWRYPFALSRIVDLLGNDQAQDMGLTAWTLARLANIPAWATGLKVGFPYGSAFEPINKHLSRIRTHLDAFSHMECAALAYCGYLSAEKLIPNFPELAKRIDPDIATPLRSFEYILPPPFGPVTCTLEELQQHLRYSHLLLEPVRWLARKFFPMR